jgi:dipeptidyl aminopeptidase/acylaminoacyl peptidase
MRNLVAALATVVALAACATPVPTPSPTASPHPTTSPTPTASPSLTAPPPPTAGLWKVLVASDSAGAAWSPDGRWLLVWDQVTNGTPADRHVSLDDPQGNLIRAFQGENPVWLDPRSFVITRDGRSYLGTVDATTFTPVSPTFMGNVYSNGHGALAFDTSATFDASARFVVWRQAGASAPRPGVAVAWSRDGTKLAVWHWTSGTGPESYSGWLEVLSWPGLRQLAAVHDRPSGPFLHQTLFDPSGRYVAFLCGKVCVLDLTAGQTTVANPSMPSDFIAWSQAGLVIPSLADGSVAIYDVRGVRQRLEPNLGDSASASADGSTVALSFNSDQRPIVLLGPIGQRSIAVPGPVQADPQLSPDGSGLVVVCAVDRGYQALLLTP